MKFAFMHILCCQSKLFTDFMLDRLKLKPIYIGVWGGGQGGARAPPVRPETLISRAISTLESGNLPYHVKTICSNRQKSIKKGTIPSSKRGKLHLRDSTFQNFRGGECSWTPPMTLV